MPTEEERAGIVSNAKNVGHADIVNNAEQTDKATVVTHADKVGSVQIVGESLRTDRTRRLGYIREIARNSVTLCALLVMVFVIFDKNKDEQNLKAQLVEFQEERTASDLETANKLECTRRYQDIIDGNGAKQLILIAEFLVVITQIPPGEEREVAVKEKITQLDEINLTARDSVTAKIEYNNNGNPLPCPLSESSPIPTAPPPNPPLTTIPETPTT